MQGRESELRRIPLPRTPVNRLASDTPKAEDKCVIQHTVLYDTDLPDDPCYTRYLQTTAIAYGRLISVSVECVWTLLRVAFFFWARPRKTGDTGCTEQGGDSHEREQSTKAQPRKALPMRDQPLVRWSILRRSRQGEGGWSPSVREARPRGQAGRADLLLGRDALPHRSLVQGSKPPPEGRCRRATGGSAHPGNLCQAEGVRRSGCAKEQREALGTQNRAAYEEGLSALPSSKSRPAALWRASTSST